MTDAFCEKLFSLNTGGDLFNIEAYHDLTVVPCNIHPTATFVMIYVNSYKNDENSNCQIVFYTEEELLLRYSFTQEKSENKKEDLEKIVELFLIPKLKELNISLEGWTE